MIDYNEIFNDSYERVHKNPEPFYDAFYENFIAKSDTIKGMFNKVDMDTQKSMLQDSIGYLISFYTTKQANDYFIHLADSHSKKLSITHEMYDLWLDTMMATVQALDPKYNHDVEVAWRIVLAPGIAFMKFYIKP